MRFRIHLATALLCSAAVIATGQLATAQSQSTSLLRSSTTAAPGTSGGGGMQAAPMPPGSMNSMGPMSSSGPSEGYLTGSSGDGGYGSCGCGENYCDQGCCDAPCGGGYVGPSGL